MNSNSAEKGNVFRNRNFRLVFLGALVSELGALLYSFAVGFYILQISNPVLHKPHSSRPWKQLKYKNPLLYYWRKLTQRRDKI